MSEQQQEIDTLIANWRKQVRHIPADMSKNTQALAAVLGETVFSMLVLLSEMMTECGSARMLEHLKATRKAIKVGDPATLRADGQPRTLGGAFIYLARSDPAMKRAINRAHRKATKIAQEKRAKRSQFKGAISGAANPADGGAVS